MAECAGGRSQGPQWRGTVRFRSGGASMAQFDLPLAELRRYRPERDEPADFDDFWRGTLEASAKHDLAAEFTAYDALLPGVRIYDVRYAGYDGQRVAGW